MRFRHYVLVSRCYLFYHDMVAYYETERIEKETEQTLEKFKVKLKAFRRTID